MVSDEVMANVDVFGSWVVNWILRDSSGTIVVT